MAHQQYQSCIDACNKCADLCDHCASACLSEGNVNEMTRCVALDIDCAAICRLAAGYMARGSELAKEICQAKIIALHAPLVIQRCLVGGDNTAAALYKFA